MKSIVIALIALSSSMAFAGALDVQDGIVSTGPSVAVACTEGARSVFTEAVPGTDRYINVVRTCVNGSYYPKTSTVARPCKEGAVAFWEVSEGVNDHQVTVKFVCVNGKYVRAN